MCTLGRVDEGTCRRRRIVTRQLKGRGMLSLVRQRGVKEVSREGELWVFEGLVGELAWGAG